MRFAAARCHKSAPRSGHFKLRLWQSSQAGKMFSRRHGPASSTSKAAWTRISERAPSLLIVVRTAQDSAYPSDEMRCTLLIRYVFDVIAVIVLE